MKPASLLIAVKRCFRFQEAGLVGVILVLGLLLTVFGGSVNVPVFTMNSDGIRERVMKPNSQGELEPVSTTRNTFLNAKNLTQLAKDTSFIAIMAVGATIVIISGGIDLSVGAIYALASVVGAMVLHQFGPDGSSTQTSHLLGVTLGIAACIGTATLCGLFNGGMTVVLRVHPFIITLGTMAIYRGIAFVLTNGQSIGGFPESFRNVVQWEIGENLSVVPLLITVVVGLLGVIFLGSLAEGRRVYAIGGNELASRYSGIRVERVKLLVFVIAGLVAGLSAVLSLGYYGAATSGDGQGYELNVIAAAVIGGASLAGGKGTALGAVLGALIIQMINSGIVILRIDQNYSQIIIGAVVIIAVMLDQVNAWLERRRLTTTASR